ncbi:hypothetical protein [Pseudomonas veronii]|uniref:hypothetical protein n=1 Tax=Pseudomonas veronii TaxID=76761 RepID=UPI002D77E31B|nr:hypothetical protein [Pseudomonas veronii]WRU66047.1 hypothetical protein VPH48_32765 [Pseudomonas veronii]
MIGLLNGPFKCITIVALAALAVPAFSCDWTVNKTTDPMTDAVTCWVSSASAKVSFYRHGKDRPNVYNKSAYSESWLMIRVDGNKAISMGENAYTRQKALDELLPQIRTGKRLRTTFNDYPERQDGDAQICNLPKLLDACNS